MAILDELDQYCLHLFKSFIESCLKAGQSLKNEKDAVDHNCQFGKFVNQILFYAADDTASLHLNSCPALLLERGAHKFLEH